MAKRRTAVAATHGNKQAGAGRPGFRGFQDVKAHGVVRGVMKDEDQVVKAHDLMKPARQLMEKRLQIPMGDNRIVTASMVRHCCPEESSCAIGGRSPISESTPSNELPAQ